MEIKSRYPDAILFFRLGDFYEMFFEDAELASRLLDIALTSRDKGAKEKVPMCGVPAANAAPYINRLVEAGYKVAICEQVEDPKQAKGLVRREVIRVITPGLNVDQDSLKAKDHHFVAALKPGKRFGLALLDLSTGEFLATLLADTEELLSEVFRREPRELLVPESSREDPLLAKIKEILPALYLSVRAEQSFEGRRGEALLKEHYQVLDLAGFGLSGAPEAVAAAGALLDYVQETQKLALEHLSPVRFYHLSRYLVIDEATKRNLELLRNNLDGSKKGSLLWVLDKTCTPMGGRLLKDWLLYLCGILRPSALATGP
jgi:DNA mismatch repair protein MutS